MSLGKRIAGLEKPRREIVVAEWGEDGEPLKLFSLPVTAADVAAVSAKNPGFLQNASPNAMVDLIIRKCEDEAGKPAFTLEDKPILMRQPMVIIGGIYALLFAHVSVEDQVKN